MNIKTFLWVLTALTLLVGSLFINLVNASNTNTDIKYFVKVNTTDIRNVGYVPNQYEIIKLNEDGSIYSKTNYWK